MKVAIVLLAVVAAVAADSYSYKPAYKDEYAYAPAHYKYDWAVKDEYSYVDMNQYEARDGDKTTGSYSVVLPDGRKQTVNYYVDGYSGYVADVSYDGYAKAYDHKTYSAPAYSKPAYHAPSYSAPHYTAPHYETAYSAPVYKAEYEPVYHAPAHY